MLYQGELVTLYGQTRFFYAMARDGLLPRSLSNLHPLFRTPVTITLLTGLATALTAGFLPLDPIAELVNVGALAAFIIVAVSVIRLRKTRPELQRPFRCPLVPLIPVLCISACGILIAVLSQETQIRFLIWFCFGIILYFISGLPGTEAPEDPTSNRCRK